MTALQDPKRQAIFFSLIVAIVYIILARPVEYVTDFIVDGEQVYLTAGPAGMRILDVDAIDPSKVQLKLKSSLTMGGYANALVVQKPYAYFANGRSGVMAVKLDDNAAPQELDTTEMRGDVQDLAILDKYLYVAAGSGGLRSFKIKDDGKLEDTKESPIDGDFTRLVAADGLLYAADDRTLRIYQPGDDPKKPKEIGLYKVNDTIRDILVEEQGVFVSADQAGLFMLDATHPETITQKMVLQTSGQVMGAALYDQDQVLVADGKKGLRLFDIRDLANPCELEFYETWSRVTQVAYVNGRIYVADGANGLRVLELKMAFDAERMGDAPKAAALGLSRSSFHNNDYLYLAYGGLGMRVLRREKLQEVAFLDTPGSAFAVAVRSQDSKAFVADGGGVYVIDLKELNDPTQSPGLAPVSMWDAKDKASVQDVLLSSDQRIAYLADGPYGVIALDLANLSDMKPSNEERIPGEARRLDMAGTTLYVAAGEGGVSLLTLLDPRMPTAVGQVTSETLNGGSALAVDAIEMSGSATLAYVAAGKAGLCLVQAPNAETPQFLYCIQTPGAATDVAVNDQRNLLYVADDSGRLLVYSLADCFHPKEIVNQEAQGRLSGVLPDGNSVYLLDDAHGVRRFDVQSPSTPLAAYRHPLTVESMLMRDNKVYLVDGRQPGSGLGLRILDARKPKGIFELGAYYSTGQAQAVQVAGNLAYIAAGTSGLQIVDISATARPRFVAGLVTGGDARYLSVWANTVYVANGDAGLAIVDISTPSQPRLVGNFKDGLPGAANWVGVLAGGDYVLVVCQDGLASVLVRDPRHPQLADVLPDYRDVQDIAIWDHGSDHYALIAAGQDGLITLDVSRPARLQAAYKVRDSVPAYAVAVAGTFVFLSQRENGVRIYHLLPPSDPVLTSTWEDVKDIYRMSAVTLPIQDTCSQDKARFNLYAAPDQGGLAVIRSKIKPKFKQVGLYETPGTAPFWEVVYYEITRAEDGLKSLSDWFKENGLETPSKVTSQVRAKSLDTIKAVSNRLGTRWPEYPASAKPAWTLRKVLLGDLFVFGFLGLLLWTAFTAQFALPAQSVRERLLAISRLYAYLFGTHGTMARVRDGQIYRPLGDEARQGPGVALVDLSSGLVLEKRVLERPFLLRLLFKLLGIREPTPQAPYGWQRSGDPLPGEPTPPERVVGPGLVFTAGNPMFYNPKYDEVAARAVDLRNQVRTSEEVFAFTQDGIEVKNRIFTVFAVGQAPDVLEVTLLAEEDSQHREAQPPGKNGKDPVSQPWRRVRVVRFKRTPARDERNRERTLLKVDELSDELEEMDARQVVQFSINLQERSVDELQGSRADRAAPGPYLFDPQRVIAAAMSRADRSADEKPAEWTDLPEKVAIDIYRNLLSRKTYDQLYRPDVADEYPLMNFKRKEFMRRVRNMGVLSFRLVERADRLPLTPGMELYEDELIQHAVQPFIHPYVLRVRGIKILTAGLTEIKPVNDEVRLRMLTAWRSKWQRDTELTRTDYELRAMHVRNQARVQVQRDMIEVLERIVRTDGYSKEALALRVFQALEGVAADPQTRQFLPAETIEMLRTLHQWLLPGDDAAGAASAMDERRASGLPGGPYEEGREE